LLRCTAALADGLVVTGAQTVCEAAGGGGKLLRLLRHLVLKLTILPGQARDTHRESTQKRRVSAGKCTYVQVADDVAFCAGQVRNTVFARLFCPFVLPVFARFCAVSI
jgi:hypothetical protein